jgi:carboxymethylenebutenolidase
MKLHRPFAALMLALVACAVTATPAAFAIPPGEAGAKEAIEKSPRHKEYVDVQVEGMAAPLKSYVVFPEKKDKAPVVIVIQEIFGLSDWIKSVADQLAADGFIAVAPDMLSGRGKGGGGTEGFASRDEITQAVRAIKGEDAMKMIDAVRKYGKKLPASNGRTATVGFCWGGARSFEYAVHTDEVDAAVVYYGTNPDPAALGKVKAPVLGLYGSDDARVNATVPPAEAKMKELNKPYTVNTYEGAGHGFLRQQDGRNGANRAASEKAWAATLEFLRQHTKT